MKKRLTECKRGRESFEDHFKSGRQKTSTTDEQVDIIYRMIFDDRRLSSR